MGIHIDLFAFFYMLTSSYGSTICWRYFVPLYNLKNQVFIDVWINIQVFVLIRLVNLSLFMLILSCLHYNTSLIELDVKYSDTYRIVLVIQIFLFLHMKLIIILSRSVKNCVGILILTALNLYIASGRLSFLLGWSYLFKSMGDLLIFWYLLQFRSSKT